MPHEQHYTDEELVRLADLYAGEMEVPDLIEDLQWARNQRDRLLKILKKVRWQYPEDRLAWEKWCACCDAGEHDEYDGCELHQILLEAEKWGA